MSPLVNLIRDEIVRTGPMPLDRYMELALSHSEYGYYRTRDPLGAQGDFITAPEVSQMFGEMLGLWLAQVWMDQGAPSPFALIELGPGRGTLMADVLRATRKVPGFHESAQIWLVETSPVLRAACEVALQETPINWAETLSDVPDLACFLLANEFFDALPVRQFQKIGDQWLERCVAIDGDQLAFDLCRPRDAGPHVPSAAFPDGAILERCRAGEDVATEIGRRLTKSGAALIIDYGEAEGTGDTVQALRGHARHPVLQDPGQADITAHVGFDALSRAAKLPAQLDTQGAFLERLGITARANQLAGQPGHAEQIIAAHRRLTHADEMGKLFKVLGLRAPDAPALPGFDP